MRRRWKLAIIALIAIIIMTRIFADDDDECEREPRSALRAACDANDLDAVIEAALNAEKEELDRALCESAREGKLEVVVVLLGTPGIDVNAIYDGRTAIYWAASSVDPDTIKFLLDRGANLSIKSINTKYAMYKDVPDLTPLHGLTDGWYTREGKKPGDDEAVRRATLLLLDAGCDVNAANKHGYTLLFDALRLGLPILDILLERGADPNYQDKKGNTPVHFFHTIKERPADLKLIMSYGAKLDIPSTDDGLTPLHSFARYSRMDIAMLQPYVSDWNLTDANGNTLIHITAEKHNSRSTLLPELLKLGLDVNRRNNEGCQAIHMISDTSWGWEETLDLLLAAGADLEARDNHGRTLLARALFNGLNYSYRELIPHLISRGANLNTQDYQGNGVLHYVVQPHRLEDEALQFLLGIGADPNMANYNGDTLLHRLAANLGLNPKETLILAIEKQLEMGVSPVVRNFRGRTPLHMLCSVVSEKHFGVPYWEGRAPMEVLLDAGLSAGVNIADNDGILPIHLAATVSEVLVAKLISRGADITAVTKDGRNLLHIASTARQSNVVGLLLDHYESTGQLSSMVNAACRRGRTPLHEAARSGRLETVTLLLKAGANVDAVDRDDKGVLEICSEFTEEKQLWDFNQEAQNVDGLLAAAGILGTDEKRPHMPADSGYRHHRIGLHQVHTEHDTVSISPIVRLLVAHGARFLGEDLLYSGNLLHRAITDGPEDMVVEITRLADEKDIEIQTHEELRLDYLKLRSQHLPAIMEKQFQNYISNIDLGYLLLCGHHEEIVQGLERTSPSDRGKDRQTGLADFLDTLAQYGYHELFARVGVFMTRPNWINGSRGTLGATLLPYLLGAAQRPLPNFEMIKVIVEKFHADVNLRYGQGMDKSRGSRGMYCSSRFIGNKQYEPGDTVLHYLVQGGHWWHESAINYLLEHGADPNARNDEGMTPLHYAARLQRLGGYRQKEIVQILLDGGADPNIAADDQNTPLSVAEHDKGIVQLLMDHGAHAA